MTTTTVTTPSRIRTAGLLTVVGAAIGAIGGLVMAFYPPAVGEDRFSYPFTPTGHRIAETAFAVNHVLLLIGVLAVGWAGAAGRGRAGRVGLGATAAGLVLITLCEVGAILLAGSAYPTDRTDLLDMGYGVSSILIGVGLIVAGVAVVRAGRWRGWTRWAVLATGVAVFVVVLPGVFGPMVAGRLVLVAWMLLWAAVGLALVRES